MKKSGATGDHFTDFEVEFLAERDSFYWATVGATGWPYVQHRGGPKGFLKVIDSQTLALADFRGNKQYISTGNLLTDNRRRDDSRRLPTAGSSQDTRPRRSLRRRESSPAGFSASRCRDTKPSSRESSSFIWKPTTGTVHNTLRRDIRRKRFAMRCTMSKRGCISGDRE